MVMRWTRLSRYSAGHLVGGLQPHAPLDLGHHRLPVVRSWQAPPRLQHTAAPQRFSTTRTALPSERGIVCGRDQASARRRARWPSRSRSATRRRSATERGMRRPRSRRSAPAAPAAGSTCTSSRASVLERSTTQLVVRLPAPSIAEQRRLDLGGIEVHALDDQHVVRAPLDARDARARCGRSGRARSVERGDVARCGSGSSAARAW